MTGIARLVAYERCLVPLPSRMLAASALALQFAALAALLVTGFPRGLLWAAMGAEGIVLAILVAVLVVYAMAQRWATGTIVVWLSLPQGGHAKLVVLVGRALAEAVAAWLPSAAMVVFTYSVGHLLYPQAMPFDTRTVADAAWLLAAAAIALPVWATFLTAIGMWSQYLTRLGRAKGLLTFLGTYVAVYAVLISAALAIGTSRPGGPLLTTVAPDVSLPLLPAGALYVLAGVWLFWCGRWLETGAEVRSFGTKAWEWGLPSQ